MSLLNTDTIDALGQKDGELRALISDELDWSDEKAHLVLLRDKINTYLKYLGEKQYEKSYGQVETVIVDICFKHAPTELGRELVKQANRSFNYDGIYFVIHC